MSDGIIDYWLSQQTLDLPLRHGIRRNRRTPEFLAASIWANHPAARSWNRPRLFAYLLLGRQSFLLQSGLIFAFASHRGMVLFGIQKCPTPDVSLWFWKGAVPEAMCLLPLFHQVSFAHIFLTPQLRSTGLNDCGAQALRLRLASRPSQGRKRGHASGRGGGGRARPGSPGRWAPPAR